MKTKSIGMNAALNMVRTICRVIFPLITFPYVSRVLHVNNMGIFNFCSSIISYFTLAAGLGINTYSIREGARLRNNKNEMDQFASEVFSINLIATVLSYAVLFFCIALIPRLRIDASILIALSLSIIFTTVGCEWVFNIYEDFAFITIRSVIFQIAALILMFTFVRSEKDLLPYALISAFSTAGPNVANLIARRKYCRIRFVINRNMLKRLIPILVLFANSIATTIYTNSDMTMVGAISGDVATGLYSVSTKIYNLVKELLAAIIIVSIPRLSSYLGERKTEDFNKTANEILNALIVVVVPAVIGIFALSKDIILVISGREYINATASLQILSVALFFSIFSWFYTSCILVPYREEKKVLVATIVAAVVNIGLNFVLIPLWQQNAAALTTVIAEFLSMIICWFYGRKYFHAKVKGKDLISVAIGCIGIIAICFLTQKHIGSFLISAIVAIIGSVALYTGILIITNNSSFRVILGMIRHKSQ
jgi:O-antigen/teichoic acid export membrane protein